MASIVLAVVVVVLLGGGPRDSCDAVHPTRATNCTSDTEILKSGEEKMIHSEDIRAVRWEVGHWMFMVPKTGFEGVRAEVETNKGTFPAWFPIMDHCALNDSRWWQMSLVVKKSTSSSAKATLTVRNCCLSYELITDAKRTSSNDLELRGLELFGRGPSTWSQQRPSYPCKVEDVSPQPVHFTPLSCINLPPHGNAFPPLSNAGQQPTQQPTQQTTQQPTQQTTQQPKQRTLNTTTPTTPATPLRLSESSEAHTGVLTPTLLGVVVLVVMVVIVMVVVMVLLMMRRRHRQENEAGSQLTESIQEVHVTRNSLYEPLDKYQQDSGTPGQGEAPHDNHY